MKIGVTIILLTLVLSSYAYTEKERLRDGQHLIIYPADFYDQAQEIVDLYEENFQITRVLMDQQEIFDTYNDGIPDPEAIKSYLIDFFDDPLYWENSTVLLLGSGTEDFDLNIEKNKIITFNGKDDLFVAFDNDLIPDVPIGRIPASNIAELELYIESMSNYLTEFPYDFWRNEILLVADDEYKSGELEGCSANSGMNHTARTEDIANLLPPSIHIDKVYGIEYEFDEYGNKPEASAEIITELNQGKLIWLYTGHGDYHILGDEYYFSVEGNLSQLETQEKKHLFLAASCNVGEFDNTEFDCLAELLLFLENGGAIASIAASRACGPINNNMMMQTLYQKITEADYSIGYSLLKTKQESEAIIITMNLYNLLGDPLLPIHPPQNGGDIFISTERDTLYYEDNVSLAGYSPSIEAGNVQLKVYEANYELEYTNTLGDDTYYVEYWKSGSVFHENNLFLENHEYSDFFAVPEGINTGDTGKILAYLYNESDQTEVLSFLYPLYINESQNGNNHNILPALISLYNNYPNPFNPQTTIKFELNQSQNVKLSIFNLKGQKVKSLVDSYQTAGIHFLTWDGSDSQNKIVSAGVYFYILESAGQKIVKKMTLLK